MSTPEPIVLVMPEGTTLAQCQKAGAAWVAESSKGDFVCVPVEKA